MTRRLFLGALLLFPATAKANHCSAQECFAFLDCMRCAIPTEITHGKYGMDYVAYKSGRSTMYFLMLKSNRSWIAQRGKRDTFTEASYT
jgi:hypothetical protein